jgi:hypothetical protein
MSLEINPQASMSKTSFLLQLKTELIEIRTRFLEKNYLSYGDSERIREISEIADELGVDWR